jgi:primosomal protein N' (replication factor Y)
LIAAIDGMPEFVEIAVNVPQVSQVFDYQAPDDLQDQLNPGVLVEVPFGKQQVQGVVIRAIEQPSVPEIRPVSAVLDPDPVLTQAQISLALYLASHSLLPLAACVALMLPPGLGQQADTLYHLIDPTYAWRGNQKLSRTASRLLELLAERGDLRGRQIDQAIHSASWRPVARRLVDRGVLGAGSVLPSPQVGRKLIRNVSLACSPEQARLQLPNLGKGGSQALIRRQKIIELLIQEDQAVDVSWVYAHSGGKSADLRKLAEMGLVRLGERQTWRDPLDGQVIIPTQAPPLTADQDASWLELNKDIHAASNRATPAPVLLHGVTGSGKTEIYLRAVEESLELGRQAIVLVPEISLTPQTIRRFASRFPGRVGVLHSSLSTGERYDTWRRTNATTILITKASRPFMMPAR